jgi:Holliday junction resolvase RusA-like endonuclease
MAKRPDYDNLAKGLCDAMTKAGFWKDDGQISQALIVKVYDDRIPHTEVQVRELEEIEVSR